MVDVIKTRTELKTQALYELQLIQNGQTANSDDLAVVEEYVDPVIGSLNARGVAYIGDSEEIPVEAFMDLAVCLAVAASGPFGIPKDQGKLMMAEENLRVISQRVPAPNKYLSVDKGLQARGTPLTAARWSSGNF